jgi:ribosome biogenesis protein NSA2
MKKLLKAHEEKDTTVKADSVKEGALPPYLLDREKQSNSKILANTIKQKRKEKAGKWTVPI